MMLKLEMARKRPVERYSLVSIRISKTQDNEMFEHFEHYTYWKVLENIACFNIFNTRHFSSSAVLHGFYLPGPSTPEYQSTEAFVSLCD